MIDFPIKNGQKTYQKVKQYLQDHDVPYEMKHRTFYVRKKEFDRFQNDLNNLVSV
ncbi:hypothetical protein [Scopulibacillus cellulosilyticus]|uniref:Uncharacterized protein n=1 Tax=Scopulibacillus cellulosilyticus TaxID=2665665 RepID=A0ABW2PVG5_9BACL